MQSYYSAKFQGNTSRGLPPAAGKAVPVGLAKHVSAHPAFVELNKVSMESQCTSVLQDPKEKKTRFTRFEIVFGSLLFGLNERVAIPEGRGERDF